MNTTKLPNNYEFFKQFDLKKNKGMNLTIQLLGIAIIAGLIVLARHYNLPLHSNWHVAIVIVVTVLLSILYIFAHELVHGIFIKLLSGVKPDYFIRFPFFCTGSDKAYFNKKSFAIVALSPVIIWGVILLGLLFIVNDNIFISIYIVFIINMAGASGDYLQIYELMKLPKDALIHDNGKVTSIFTKKM